MTAAAMTAIFALAMVTAMITDLMSMTIRNRVSISLTLGFILLAPLCGISLSDYGWHLAVGGIALIVTFSLFCLRAMGGGDAKLIAATALWFGPNTSLMDYLVMVSILGGVLTLTIILYRTIPRPLLADRYAFMGTLARKDIGIPYGIALGAAGLWTFPLSPVGISMMAYIAGAF
ncbi:MULTISPECIES: A24 family peptidase [Brucella/Ochrobactrum group]|uniref:A24 family peptidase n=1 Tax=Brucella/Ochrobactrum group TaxID=2826938 RepID=UPI001F106235|nr:MULTISPECIES: prepilin peptidase [Brucella/Ochrobactrum group]MCH4541180.1 prepilin peptidase [Ochrobactrum sp. A-1]